MQNEQKYLDIYNAYLRIIRTKQDKPFKYRKKIDDEFKKTPEFAALTKLVNFFDKFPHVPYDKFFEAPYILYPNEKTYYKLDYFSKYSAIKVYTEAVKIQDNGNPDNQIDFILQSLRFLGKFILSNGINNWNDYLEMSNGNFPTCLMHYKKRQISIYVLVEIPGFLDLCSKIPNDIKQTMFGNLEIQNKKSKLFNTKAKELIQKGLKKLLEISKK